MKKLLLVALAAALMSTGWWGISGLPMLAGLVPLLAVADGYDASRRSWRRMAGWTALFIALWYGATVWWIWNATPAAPIAAVVFAWVYTGLPFMLWFYVSKRAPKALSYTVLVAAWTVGEWIYNTNQASFPWLAAGGGFAHDTWAVQWYEWTGVYGGTLWVLITSILIYEFLVVRSERGRRIFAARNWLVPALAAAVPPAISVAMYFAYGEPERTVKVTIVQPNVDAWTESSIPNDAKARNLAELAALAPADARFVVMPETTIGETLVEGKVAASPSVALLRATVAGHSPRATMVLGAVTVKVYGSVKVTDTAEGSPETGWYDRFNSAVAVAPDGGVAIHHKAKLVTGAEGMPTWWWMRRLLALVENMGFYAGQYGKGTECTVFENGGGAPANVGGEGAAGGDGEISNAGAAGGVQPLKAGAAVCWESVYGEYCTEFVRGGAQMLLVITNDGWWGDTPGYRQHFDFSRLRAIETRRAVARSANTGRSGFITPRGDVRETLGWSERGAITDDVAVSDRVTLYTRLGDWPCRLSLLTLALGLLYFVAYRVRRRDNIVK